MNEELQIKLTYFETCVHLVSVLYADVEADKALRQRAKEEAERVMDLISKEIQ